MDLKNKNAIITGASRGIGKAIALALAAEGCNVALVARNETELNKVCAEAKSYGVKALAIALDLENMGNLKQVVEKTLTTFTKIDILINNAGYCVPAEFLEVTEELYDKHFFINLKAPFFLIQYVQNSMKENGEGHIINVSSTAALEIPSFHSAYGASKLGLVGFSKALYQTCKEFNIKVSVIYPHFTDTQMLRDIDPPVASDKWMSTDDIAGTVLFLLKSSNKMVIKDIFPIAFQTER